MRSARRLFTLTILSALVAVSPTMAQVQPTARPVSGQLTIGAAAPEGWRSVTLPSLSLSSSVGGRASWSSASAQTLIPNTLVSGFDTDLATNVVRITFQPLTIETTMSGSGPGSLLPVITRHAGQVTFTIPVASAKAVASWVNDAVSKGTPPRDVSVVVRSRAGQVVRTYVLRRCAPTFYAAQGPETVVTLQPESVDFKVADRDALFQWLAGATTGAARDVRFVAADGSRDVTMKSSAFLEYSFPTLDRTSGGEALEGFSFRARTVVGLP